MITANAKRLAFALTLLAAAAGAQASGASPGARDPFTDSARSVSEPRDPYTDGARSVSEPRDPYTDGAHLGRKPDLVTARAPQGNFNKFAEGTRLSPAKQSLFGIQLAGQDMTGVSAPPGSNDQAVP